VGSIQHNTATGASVFNRKLSHGKLYVMEGLWMCNV